MIKFILVPLDGSDHNAAVLPTALIVANRFGAHIKVVHVREKAAEPFRFSDMPESYLKDFNSMSNKALDLASDKVKEQFDSFFSKAGVEVVRKPGRSDQVTASLEILEGNASSILIAEARLVDVVAMVRPEQHESARSIGAQLESVLLHSGRPVLFVPTQWEPHRVAHAAIGWNDSVEAARVVAMTLPWMTQMEKVTVIASAKRKASVDNLIEYLDGHGCTASFHQLSEKGGNTGERILAACEDVGAEFLVVGGFHHTRARQRLFGGVTTHLMEHTNIITVMAH